MLNIFISLVYERFVVYFNYLPWNAKAPHLIGTYWSSQDPYQRLLRRTVSRYITTSFVMAMTRMSLQLKRKYPTLQSLVREGKYLFSNYISNVIFKSYNIIIKSKSSCNIYIFFSPVN